MRWIIALLIPALVVAQLPKPGGGGGGGNGNGQMGPQGALGTTTFSAVATKTLAEGDRYNNWTFTGTTAPTLTLYAPSNNSYWSKVCNGTNKDGTVVTGGNPYQTGSTGGTSTATFAFPHSTAINACFIFSWSGSVWSVDPTNATSNTTVVHTISFVVSAAGQVYAGQLGSQPCTITGWSLGSTTPGTASIDLDAHANSAPPAVPAIPNTTTDKISASAPMVITAASSSSGGASAISTWTPTVRSAWDTFSLNVVTFSGFTTLNGTVYCQ